MEKSLKKNIYIYISESLLVHLKLTQYYKSTTLQFFKNNNKIKGKNYQLNQSIHQNFSGSMDVEERQVSHVLEHSFKLEILMSCSHG